MGEYFVGLSEEDLTLLMRWALGFVLCLGAIVGSFLNVCIYRIPLEQSVVTPRSHCFGCGKVIPWYYNIPVLAWFVLRGKCAYCKSPISFRYPFIEALTALLFLLVFQMWGNPGLLGLNRLPIPELIPFFWLFVASTVVDVMIDIDHRILLDRISLGGTLITLVVSGAYPVLQGCDDWLVAVVRSLIGAGAGFGIGFAIAWLGRRIFLQDAFGFGDVKWMMLFGALFGWAGLLYILTMASLLGLVMGLGVMVISRCRKTLREGEALAIPFGPALGIAALLWLFWGRKLLAGLEAVRTWSLDHNDAMLLVLGPIALVTLAWLCVRIHFIRKAIREEEAAETEETEPRD